MDSSAFAVRYLDFAGREYTGGEITREVVDQLLNKVRAGKAFSFLLSLDEYGEDGGIFSPATWRRAGPPSPSTPGTRRARPT